MPGDIKRVVLGRRKPWITKPGDLDDKNNIDFCYEMKLSDNSEISLGKYFRGYQGPYVQ